MKYCFLKTLNSRFYSRMGHESSSEGEEETGRGKRRKKEKRRKEDKTDVAVESPEQVTPVGL